MSDEKRRMAVRKVEEDQLDREEAPYLKPTAWEETVCWAPTIDEAVVVQIPTLREDRPQQQSPNCGREVGMFDPSNGGAVIVKDRSGGDGARTNLPPGDEEGPDIYKQGDDTLTTTEDHTHTR